MESHFVDTIHCFYTDLGSAGDAELVPYWCEQWQSHGWKTRVLSLPDAQADSRFEAMRRLSITLPCLNSRAYNTASFVRWLAYANVEGAISDYDVFPIAPFPPRQFSGFTCGNLAAHNGFMVGTAADYSRISDGLLAYQQQPEDITYGRPHVSDMTIIMRHPEWFDSRVDLERGYLDPGWPTVPLCHFTNDSIVRVANGTRLEVVKQVLAERSLFAWNKSS